MRNYEIFTPRNGVFRIQCDEIKFKCDFHRETSKEALCLFQGDRVMAIFREWLNVVDVTEQVAYMKNEEKKFSDDQLGGENV